MQTMIHAVTRSCQFSYNKFVVIKCLSLIPRTRRYLFMQTTSVDHNFVNTNCKAFISSKCCYDIDTVLTPYWTKKW